MLEDSQFLKRSIEIRELPSEVFFVSPRSLLLTNMATCNDAESDGISEEIELLQAIYVNEIELLGPEERPTLVNLFLHPSTGDDCHDSKYVCLNLSLSIPDNYPFVSPSISIKNPRGLSDAHISSIQENILALAKEKIGSPMLYDLIEYARECLSDNNIPSCPCVICLEHFGREEKFVKTECYHYFHSVCLGNYVDHFISENNNEKVVCPMCRLEIAFSKSEFATEDGNSFAQEMFVYKPDQEQLAAQNERQKIFEYQKLKGGIINIEEERNKYLIGIKDRKEELGENDDVKFDKMSVSVLSQEAFRKTTSLLEGVRHGSSQEEDEQNCRNSDQIVKEDASKNSARQIDGGETNYNNQTCDGLTEGQNEDNQSLPQRRDSEGQKRDSEGQKRTQGTEMNDSRITMGQANNTAAEETNVAQNQKNFRESNSRRGSDGHKRSSGVSKGYHGGSKGSTDMESCSSGKGYKTSFLGKDGESWRRNTEALTVNKSKTKSQFKKYSQAVDGGKAGQQDRRNFRNSPPPREDWHGNSENSSEQRKGSTERVDEGENEARMVEMTWNVRGKDRGGQEKCELNSKGQANDSKEEVGSCKQGDSKDGDTSVLQDKYEVDEVKSRSTPSHSSTLRGNTELNKDAMKRENESANKQATRTQTERKQNKKTPRNTRGRTPRRAYEQGKDCKPSHGRNNQKTHSSNVWDTKRSDGLVSENDEKPLNKNFQKKEVKISPNIVDGVVRDIHSKNSNETGRDVDVKRSNPRTRRPPPGLETVTPNDNVDRNVNKEREVLSRPTSSRAAPRRPPPGFEDVKAIKKQL